MEKQEFHEYPKLVYHEDGRTATVGSKAAEKSFLAEGWNNDPFPPIATEPEAPAPKINKPWAKKIEARLKALESVVFKGEPEEEPKKKKGR